MEAAVLNRVNLYEMVGNKGNYDFEKVVQRKSDSKEFSVWMTGDVSLEDFQDGRMSEDVAQQLVET